MKSRRKRWKIAKTPAENARITLPQLAVEFFEAGRAATAADSPEALHEFRLAVKRFRYTLEAFRPLYGPGLETRMEGLRKLQELLGVLNDCATTRRLLTNGEDSATEEVRRVLKVIDQRANTKARAFKTHWIHEFDVGGAEASWSSYLARQAGRAK